MNVIRNKLRAKDGMSIFMGLMFLLVALMVGAVVLAASTASAGKLAELKKNEQDYLNVASAARMVRDRICALTYTCRKEWVNDILTSNETKLEPSDNGAVILKSELMSLCGELADEDSAPTLGTAEFEITGTDEDWDTVHGNLSMEKDGRIIVELWLKDEEDEKGKSRNLMEIEFCADGPVTSTVVNRYENWGVDNNNNPILISVDVEVIKTTTCSWPLSGCTITKGNYEGKTA